MIRNSAGEIWISTSSDDEREFLEEEELFQRRHKRRCMQAQDDMDFARVGSITILMMTCAALLLYHLSMCRLQFQLIRRCAFNAMRLATQTSPT